MLAQVKQAFTAPLAPSFSLFHRCVQKSSNTLSSYGRAEHFYARNKKKHQDAFSPFNTKTYDTTGKLPFIPPMGHLKITAHPTSGAEGEEERQCSLTAL